MIRGGIVRHQQVKSAVVIEVEECYPEAIKCFWITDPGGFADILKSTVPFVAEQMIARARKASRPAHHTLPSVFAMRGARPVRRPDAQPRRAGFRDAGRGALHGFRRRGRRQSVQIKLHIAGGKEVQLAVPIVVAKGAAGGPAIESYTRSFSHVGKGTLAVVSVQAMLPAFRYVQVLT